MKKLTLLIIVIFFGYTKGYSQLMQSNSLWPSAKEKKAAPATVEYAKKVSNSSDSLIKNIPLKINAEIPATKNSKSDPDQKALLEQMNEIVKSNGIDKKSKIALDKKIKAAEETIKKEHSEKLVLDDKVRDLVVEKYTEYLKVLDKELAEYKKEIDKNLTRAEKGFDTIYRSNGGNYQHAIDSINHRISSRTIKIRDKLTGIMPQRNEIETNITELTKLKNDLIIYATSSDSIYIRTDATIKKAEATGGTFIAVKEKFVADYNLYVDTTNNDIKALNNIAEKIKNDITTEATQAETISALGGINAILGDQGVLAPNVSIVGQKKFSSDATSSFYGEVKLFIGGNDDDKKNTGVNRLFIPDASTYGFMTDFTFGFIGSNKNSKYDILTKQYEQKLAINVGVYYLGKRLRPDTLTDFTTSLFHVKLGFQYIIIPHVLSTYINTNQILVTTNIKKFEKYYSGAKTMRSFTSFGLQSYLELNDKKDFHLFVDLGFVKINDDVNSWLNSSDSVLPNVKLSLVKTFSW